VAIIVVLYHPRVRSLRTSSSVRDSVHANNKEAVAVP
jgi:hypothetical protein